MSESNLQKKKVKYIVNNRKWKKCDKKIINKIFAVLFCIVMFGE